MITNTNKSIKDIILKIISVITAVIPFALSSAIFIGFNFCSLIISALVLSAYFITYDSKKIMPVFAGFLVVMYISNTFGINIGCIALAAAGVLFSVYSFVSKKLKISSNSVTAGFSLATALTVTVLLTTHYFGIGATGNNVKDMIASYLSLGFHPNWRGVLYGTVVMVIMITFPRKFKSFCKTVRAPFIAIIFTLVLNCFLNPSYMPTAINEIVNSSLNLTSASLGIFGRIPVHSLAVIMIVGAWESVKWGEIKKAFSSPVSVICFAATVISTLYFGYIYGIFISAVLYLIYHFYSANKSKIAEVSA